MSRQRDRRLRLLQWLLIVATGASIAQLAWRDGDVVAACAILAAAMALGHLRMIAPPGVPILTYHSVSPAAGWLPWSSEIAVHPDTFARHLATLRAMGCATIGTRALCDLRAAGRPVPANAVVLHFDDGYLDNWLYAVPALRRHGMAATFFASLDFVEPDGPSRRPGGDPSGYMNWSELRAIDCDPLFAVEPHGVDHGRVPVSARVVDRLTDRNWRALGWLQWAATPGAKHDWFRRARPSAVPLGSPVFESAPALAARAWIGDRYESADALESRIAGVLARCRASFRERLGREAEIFCWPENQVVDRGRAIAAAAGYRATTGGHGRNAASEPAFTLSRIHIGDRAIGVRWLPAEALMLRASIGLFRGNHYWYPIVATMNLARRIVARFRKSI